MTSLQSTFQALLWAHVAAGCVALPTFWVPIFSKKGGRIHVTVGRVFVWAMYVTALTALALAGLAYSEPLGVRPERATVPSDQVEAATHMFRTFAVFLGYLGLVSFTTTHHGVRVIRTRKNPDQIRTPLHVIACVLTALAGLAMIPLGLQSPAPWNVILPAMSPIGIFVGGNALRYLANPTREHMAWWYEHMGAMIGAGIASHTAFLVFGAQRMFGFRLEGPFAIVPWILPTAIGVPAIFIWVGLYRRKFRRGGA